MFLKKVLSVFLAFIIILFTASGVAYANSDDTGEVDNMRFSNVSVTSTSFTINSSGKATVKNSYVGISGVFKKAVIVTKIQKKVGIVWITISGGSWTDTSTSVSYSKSHTVNLTSTGTYRAHVVFTISGSGGSDDVITKNVQKTYS